MIPKNIHKIFCYANNFSNYNKLTVNVDGFSLKLFYEMYNT